MEKKSFYLFFVIIFMFASKPALSMDNKIAHSDKQPIFIHYVLFTNTGEKVTKIDKLIQNCNLKGISIVKDLESKVSGAKLFIMKEKISERPIPTMQMLQYFGRGFNEEYAKKIMASNVAISFVGIGPFDENHLLLKKMTECVWQIANRLDAFIFDV